MPPRKPQKKEPLSPDQLAVFEFFIKWGFMLILLLTSLYGCWWILTELFKSTTTEVDKWKYTGLGALVIWGNRSIIVHFFPSDKNK